MEVIPAAQEYGLGVIPWSPLHGGLLGGAIRKEREGGGARSTSGRSGDALADPKQRAQIQAYEDLLDKHGLEPGEVGLAWLLTRPGVTGPIVGPRTARAARLGAARGGAGAVGRGAGGPGRDLPRPGPVAGGLRLVSHRRACVASSARLSTPRADAAATTMNISTSTAAMIRFLVFGSTRRA